MSYVSRNDLGRFDIPEGENWPLRVQYFPEPPQAIRGALNPWADERKRQLYLLENQAWAEIQKLQGRYRATAATFDAAVRRYNQLISEIEAFTGKRSGLSKVMDSKGFQMASMAVTMTNPYGAAIAIALQAIKFIELGISILSGEAKRKKKRLEQLTRALEDQGKIMERCYSEMQQLAADIVYLTSTRDRGIIQQSENVKVDMAMNQIQQTQRIAANTTAAVNHALRAKLARQSSPGAIYNDSI